jgi:hypothetical protein
MSQQINEINDLDDDREITSDEYFTPPELIQKQIQGLDQKTFWELIVTDQGEGFLYHDWQTSDWHKNHCLAHQDYTQLLLCSLLLTPFFYSDEKKSSLQYHAILP